MKTVIEEAKMIYLINIHFICAYSFEYEVMKPPCF